MPDHRLPDWIDRRTAEWCAQQCEVVAARWLLRDGGVTRGAEKCAAVIRSTVAAGAPKFPAVPDA